ncbi:hypothetical protein 109_029 [Pseudomonas phage 109]|uniref:Phage protein n=1 Tax=Pseudomonas phage 109 TaxID=3056216 RepID=A0AAX4B097_9CAUD|nr:hypothetical protein 109_029 [Pseudomonas phage 109]
MEVKHFLPLFRKSLEIVPDPIACGQDDDENCKEHDCRGQLCARLQLGVAELWLHWRRRSDGAGTGVFLTKAGAALACLDRRYGFQILGLLLRLFVDAGDGEPECEHHCRAHDPGAGQQECQRTYDEDGSRQDDGAAPDDEAGQTIGDVDTEFLHFRFLRSRNGWDLELCAAEDISDDFPERRNRPLITVEVGFRIDSQGNIGSGRPFVNGALSHESGHATVTERIRPVRDISRHRVLLSGADDEFLPLAQAYRAYRLPTATAKGLASRRVLIPFMSQFTEARRTVHVIICILHRPNQNQGLEIESMIVDGRVMETKPARQLRMPHMEASGRELDLDEAQAVQRDFVLHRIRDGIHG